MEKLDLVIVGAGWHGLAMAKTYMEASHENHPRITILDEATTIGGTWALERLYSGLKTNNAIGTFEFSDFPMSPHTYGLEPGQHIPGETVHRYMTNFARHFGIDKLIRLESKALSATLLEDESWLIEYAVAGSMQAQQLIARKLVIATGLTSEPRMPQFTGQANFKGNIFHAKDLQARDSELRASCSVIVVGGNKSAWDVCYTAARSGTQVHMVMRPSGGGPSWVWRPFNLGLGHKMSIAGLSSSRFLTCFDPAPFGSVWSTVRWFLHQTILGRLLTYTFWATLDLCAETLLGYRREELQMLRPWTSTFWMGNSLSIHNYESDWFDLVRAGQIKVHHAEILSLHERSARLATGITVGCDTIVCCTGWQSASTIKLRPEWVALQSGLPTTQQLDLSDCSKILGKRLKGTRLTSEAAVISMIDNSLLHKYPILRMPRNRRHLIDLTTPKTSRHPGEPDSLSEPNEPPPYRLYRFMIPSEPQMLKMRNLAVIGAHRSVHAIIVAQAQALWITAFFHNRLEKLNALETRYETLVHSEYERLRRPKEAGGSGDRFPDLLFDSIPYVDMLLEDLGLNALRKKSLWENLFHPHLPADYRGLVQEWRDHCDRR